MKPTTKRKPRILIDSVMAEVRRAKEELAKRFNYDIAAMVKDARERQGKSGHRVVDRSTKD